MDGQGAALHIGAEQGERQAPLAPLVLQLLQELVQEDGGGALVL